jgi:hypothetical protein
VRVVHLTIAYTPTGGAAQTESLTVKVPRT